MGLGLIVGLGIGVLVGGRFKTRQPALTTAQVFQDVLSAIRERYVDSLSDEELYAKAAKGVVSTLGDPYSAFLAPKEYDAYRDLLAGRGATVGIAVETGLTGLRVRAVAPGSDADRAGVEPGDQLLAIDGKSTARLLPSQAALLLRGVAESPLRIRFKRPGDSMPIEVSLRPSVGHLPVTLTPVRLTDSVWYLALGSVAQHASRDLRAALHSLGRDGRGTVVLDLRGNVGGPLEEALAIADLFLEPGRRIGAVSKRRSLWATYAARGPNYFPNLRLAILVDRRTASSAEIIAAALRDNHRAVLIGERTFGKGLIQTTVPFPEGGALRLTTGRWQGPGGALITGGIIPDSVVVLPPSELRLRRALAREPEAFAAAMDVATASIDPLVPIDSVGFSRERADRLRASLRPAVQLSSRLFARHQDLFDLELRRTTAARRGDGWESVRFSLLTDPVVTAALAKVASRP